jgi:hypothetical protein
MCEHLPPTRPAMLPAPALLVAEARHSLAQVQHQAAREPRLELKRAGHSRSVESYTPAFFAARCSGGSMPSTR